MLVLVSAVWLVVFASVGSCFISLLFCLRLVFGVADLLAVLLRADLLCCCDFDLWFVVCVIVMWVCLGFLCFVKLFACVVNCGFVAFEFVVCMF